MRAIWLIFGGLFAAVLFGGWFLQHPAAPVSQAAPTPAGLPVVAVAERRPPPALPPPTDLADSIVRFALAQLGTPYTYAGISPATGFDCSGFVLYVFGHFSVPTPHATALLIDAGHPVARAQAQPGDIVVFTGTAATSTTPGHAGIVISAPGETPLRFVHASSAKRESGVKISQVEGTDYERRFMQVRRVLDGGASAAPTPASARQPAGAVAALPLPPAKAAKVPDLPPPLVVPLPAPGRSARARPAGVVKRKASSRPLLALHKAARSLHPTVKTKVKLKQKATAKTHRPK